MVGTKVESKEKAERVEYVLLNEAPPLHYVFRNRHDWLLYSCPGVDMEEREVGGISGRW